MDGIDGMDGLDAHARDDLALALARPELRALVMAARTQSTARTCVTAESVHAGLEHRRRRSQSRRVLVLSASLAVAASVIAAVGVSWWSNVDARDEAAQLDDTDEPEPTASDDVEDATNLDPAVRLRSTSSAEIRDAWTLALGVGTHEIELSPGAPQPLTIELPQRTLELVEGRATIEVVEHDAVVRLHVGVAAWISNDGTRTIIEVQPLGEPARADTTKLAAPSDVVEAEDPDSPAALAREADRLLAAGARAQAIECLRRLIELHPRASQTRGAVLDLGRLLVESGREREAGCAFRLYLERWPDSAVSADVEAKLAGLRAAKKKCHGLDPS